MRLASLFVSAALVPAVALAQAPVSSPAATRTARVNDDSRMICKKFAVTGSLVRTERVCKEKHYWDLEYATRRETTVTSSCGADGGVCDTVSGFGAMGRSTMSPQ